MTPLVRGLADGNVHALLGPYAVNAVSPAERSAFEAHLTACEDCATELVSLTGVAAILADSEAVAPPAHLRQRVLGDIARTAQAVPLDLDPVLDPELNTEGGDGATASPAVSAAPVTSAPPATAGRPRRKARTALFLAAASAVAIAVVAVGVMLYPGQGNDALALEREVMMIASAPDARAMDLELGAAHLVVSERMDGVAAMGHDAPMPSAGMEYQLWLVMDDGTAHAGPTFMPSKDGDFMALMHTDFHRVSGFAVTEEPIGGSSAPTGELVAHVSR